MLRRIVRPESFSGQLFYHGLLSSIIVGVVGCSTPPRVEKPPTSIARAMETRPFQGDLRTVLKASINSFFLFSVLGDSFCLTIDSSIDNFERAVVDVKFGKKI